MSDTIKNGVTRHKLTPEENKKGAANSIRKKREKKTISEILKKWADGEIKKREEFGKALEEAGISGDLTNKSLLALSIINNVKSGDLKSVKYAVQLLNEDKRFELENEKLREEIEFLKIRQEELKSQLSLMQSLKDKITINMDVNKDE